MYSCATTCLTHMHVCTITHLYSNVHTCTIVQIHVFPVCKCIFVWTNSICAHIYMYSPSINTCLHFTTVPLHTNTMALFYLTFSYIIYTLQITFALNTRILCIYVYTITGIFVIYVKSSVTLFRFY